jgi:orotidine-5'-phosphate decarboxylase
MFFNKLSERLIVAVDFEVNPDDPDFPPIKQAEYFLDSVCDELGLLGVTLKINTLARILGARAVEMIHNVGLKCFLDAKIFDIGNTLQNDTAWIKYYKPLILTVAERVKPAAFKKIQAALPETLVLPVGPLTDLDDKDFVHFDEGDREQAVGRFFRRSGKMNVRGVICGPKDIRLAAPGFLDDLTVVTPAVQPEWTLNNDNSANSLTPAAAIAAGAHAIVVGRGITAAKITMRDAAMHTLGEIEKAWGMKNS